MLPDNRTKQLTHDAAAFERPSGQSLKDPVEQPEFVEKTKRTTYEHGAAALDESVEEYLGCAKLEEDIRWRRLRDVGARCRYLDTLSASENEVTHLCQ